MRDRLTKQRRSWNMSRIRGKNTSPEMAVRRLLHRMGYRFRLHVRIPIPPKEARETRQSTRIAETKLSNRRRLEQEGTEATEGGKLFRETGESTRKSTLSRSHDLTVSRSSALPVPRSLRYVRPDIVLPKYKTAIFVHGCFWHRPSRLQKLHDADEPARVASNCRKVKLQIRD